MTKAEFLKDLDRRLQILKEQEREDILGEYAQHIELKMENGLSEEEAIRDFGDLEELADEILDAYNVDPLYGKKEKAVSRFKMEELGGKASRIGRRIGDEWKAALQSGWRLICRGAAGLKHGLLVFVHWLPFGDRVVTEDGVVVKERTPFLETFRRKRSERKTVIRERSDTTMWNKVSLGVQILGRGLGRLIRLCFRLGVVLLVVAPAAFGDCLALVGLGMLVVMVVLGYPLIGITVMTLGALACGVSFVLLIWNLMYGKKKPAAEMVMKPVTDRITDRITDTIREEEDVQVWESEEL